MKRTAPKLKKLYDRLNKKYFGGRLPKKTRVGWANLKYQGCVGLCTYSTPPKIEITTELLGWNRLVESTLLHEMTHISATKKHGAAGCGHGAEFQKEMLKLAKAGAFRRLW